MNSEGCGKELKNSVELDKMTKDFGLLVNIFGGGECLKHLVGGQQLHIDYKPETLSVERSEVSGSVYSIGAMIMNEQTLVGVSKVWLDGCAHKVIHVIHLRMMVLCGHTNEDENTLRTIFCSLLLSTCLLHAFQYQH
jgi:hypothetical protein